jgi:hypothetical protein
MAGIGSFDAASLPAIHRNSGGDAHQLLIKRAVAFTTFSLQQSCGMIDAYPDGWTVMARPKTDSGMGYRPYSCQC